MKQTAPTAGRAHKRPFWVDPRFAIGLVLVVGSIVGVSAVVASVDDTVQIYSARTTLAAGTTITAGDLDTTAVRLGSHEARYLAIDDLPEDGLVLIRAVSKGELVPAAAVSKRATIGFTSVVVSLKSEVAESVAPGATVDLWGSEQLEHGRYGPPLVVVASAEVVRSIEESGLMGSASGAVRSIELQVPSNKVAAVLQAIANGDALSLVASSASLASSDGANDPQALKPNEAPDADTAPGVDKRPAADDTAGD